MNKKILVIFIILLTLILTAWLKYRESSAASITIIPAITPTLTPTPTAIPTPITVPLRLAKESYTIALYGDSMIDTMGEKLEILQKELYRSYPKTTFHLYNYGIGAQNIEASVARFESDFLNRERSYPPITAIKADIIILGTFAYNPFVPHDLEKYKTQLTALIQKAKNVTPNVFLIAEIAPKKIGFGQGKQGVNWPEDQAYQHALNIVDQLKTAINVAHAQGVPVINVYAKSLIDDTFGNPVYVRQEDGIHPSYAGHLFMAQTIISSLKFY